MAHILEMPKLSDTMKEGSIVKWLKKEGEKISSGDPLLEIETDKANMEYESPYSGVLLKILVGDAQKCALQDPIAVIGKSDEKWEEELKKYQTKKSGTTETKSEPTVKPEQRSVQTQEDTKDKDMDSRFRENEKASIKASPLAKKIAADLGINLANVKGSGPNDRIVQRDLTNYQTKTTSRFTRAKEVQYEPRKIPLTNMRKTIAQRLTQSVTTAPHFYLKISINMTNLLESRKVILAQEESRKFSVNDMIIYFVSQALLEHPEINSSWQDDHIIEYPFVHMSVAVALPQGGLVTPVVRNAHALNIFEIAEETSRLITLARSSKLSPADYSGGTFSISNLGMSGIEDFTAIINPPQAAILAVGSTIPTPVVSSNGNVVIEQRMTVSLSCDHRVIDGLMGAKFLQTLKNYFEHPITLLFAK